MLIDKVTFKYTWNLPTDEEIQQAIDEEGYHGIYTPQDVHKYIADTVYDFFRKEVEKQYDTL